MKERLRRRSTRWRALRRTPRTGSGPQPRAETSTRRGLDNPRLLLAAAPRTARRGSRRPRLRDPRGRGRAGALRGGLLEPGSTRRRARNGPVTDALRRGLSPGSHSRARRRRSTRSGHSSSPAGSPTTRSRSCGWRSRASSATANDSSTTFLFRFSPTTRRSFSSDRPSTRSGPSSPSARGLPGLPARHEDRLPPWKEGLLHGDLKAAASAFRDEWKALAARLPLLPGEQLLAPWPLPCGTASCRA